MAAGASLVGAGLAYLGARRGSRPEQLAVTQSERDEWGRRFTTAIELMTDTDERRVLIGQALLGALLDSDLAQADDRRIATRLLRESALADLGMPAAPALHDGVPGIRPNGPVVDDVEFVEDDGGIAEPTAPVAGTPAAHLAGTPAEEGR